MICQILCFFSDRFCVLRHLGSHPRGLRAPFQAAAFPIISISIEPEFVVVAASEHVHLFVESPSHCDVMFPCFSNCSLFRLCCVATCSAPFWF